MTDIIETTGNFENDKTLSEPNPTGKAMNPNEIWEAESVKTEPNLTNPNEIWEIESSSSLIMSEESGISTNTSKENEKELNIENEQIAFCVIVVINSRKKSKNTKKLYNKENNYNSISHDTTPEYIELSQQSSLGPTEASKVPQESLTSVSRTPHELPQEKPTTGASELPQETPKTEASEPPQETLQTETSEPPQETLTTEASELPQEPQESSQTEAPDLPQETIQTETSEETLTTKASELPQTSENESSGVPHVISQMESVEQPHELLRELLQSSICQADFSKLPQETKEYAQETKEFICQTDSSELRKSKMKSKRVESLFSPFIEDIKSYKDLNEIEDVKLKNNLDASCIKF
ncbi:110 kDa antigen-like [Procambarus clarkii]|uniref:110 kDa antigen-like n=1 Tax=Procambarus clarkii TaxID=6728 RepID=UPI0037443F51